MAKIIKILWPVPLGIIFFLVINSFIHLGIPPDPIDKINTQVLFADTAGVCLNSDEIKAHNMQLISVLNSYMALDITSFEGRENLKSQNRLFYAAILAALVSLLFMKDTPKLRIKTFLLFFIVLMYFLEVHREDLDNRYFVGYDIKGLAVEKLINDKFPTTWYYVTGDSLTAKMKEANKLENRIPRKLLRVINPDLEQVAFYLIPFSAIYWLPVFNSKKRRKMEI